jgi:hypothetical protein
MDIREVPFSAMGGLYEDDDVEATREFARLTPGHWEEGAERQIAAAIVGVFDGFFRALTRISAAATA